MRSVGRERSVQRAQYTERNTAHAIYRAQHSAQRRAQELKAVIIGTGIDILEINRFAEAIGRRGERFLARVFTAAELENCQGRVERLAVRFAAKEAFLKAIGTGFSGVTWHDMSVLTSAGGAPVMHLSGAARRLAEKLGVARIHLSLSHSKINAVAVVVLES